MLLKRIRDIVKLVGSNLKVNGEVRFVSLFTFVLLFYAIIYDLFFIYLFLYPGFVVPLSTVAVLALSSYALMWQGYVSRKIYANFLTGLLLYISFHVSASTGGIYSTGAIWFVTVPSLASMMLGSGPGAIWMVFAFLGVIGLSLNEFIPLGFVSNHIPPDRVRYFDLINLVAQLLLMSVIVIFSEVEKAIANQRSENLRAVSIGSSKMASIGEISSGIAHEIKNALAVINGAVSLLRKGYGSDGFEINPTMAMSIFEKTERMIFRIDRIVKSMQRASYQREKLEFSYVKLDEILTDVTTLAEIRVNKNMITLKPRGTGTGIGLNLAKKWAEAHRGVIYYDELCERSQFILELNSHPERRAGHA
jgi:signal transduction histidine kinase